MIRVRERTALRRFSFAVSGFTASSNGISDGLASNSPANPARSNASFSSIRPDIRQTGTSKRCARLKIPEGTFPIKVCKSEHPSPVITRLASGSTSSKRAASSITSIPGSRRAPRKAHNAPPSPPAAPAPARHETSLPNVRRINAAKRLIPSSSRLICSGEAPFCGAKTCAAPLSPQKGLSTSHAT